MVVNCNWKLLLKIYFLRKTLVFYVHHESCDVLLNKTKKSIDAIYKTTCCIYSGAEKEPDILIIPMKKYSFFDQIGSSR